VAIVPAVWWVVAALRRGRVGADIIAVLALVGTLDIHEYLAGALIGVMLATGQALEVAAERRAAKDLRSLLERAPRIARRRTAGGRQTVPVDEVAIGDVLVVGPGEILPVDAMVVSEGAILDESALTGESAHSDYRTGQAVRSGAVNAGGAVEIRATATADESTYAGIVRMAQQAAAESAPVVRLADRGAAWFLPLALGVAAFAWLIGGSAERAVAVLVVATPCPLLLAAPVAIVSGLSRASRLGVVIRDGGALENLGRGHHAGAGQDGHGDHGPAARHGCARRAGVDAFGGPAARGLGGPGLAACARQSDRRGGGDTRAAAEHARRRCRGGGQGRHRDG
jgi:cation transport ATPase